MGNKQRNGSDEGELSLTAGLATTSAATGAHSIKKKYLKNWHIVAEVGNSHSPLATVMRKGKKNLPIMSVQVGAEFETSTEGGLGKL